MEKGIPSEMYKEHILELYKSPNNYGILKNKTGEKKEYNSICGDEISLQVRVEKGVLKDAKFNGSGCVLSIVSSSMIIDKVKGMKISEIKKIKNSDVLKLLKVKITPARTKCALLPFEALKGALKKNE